MKVITESEMNFGEFEEADLFHIEESKIYSNIGAGVKTVEFVLKSDEKSLIFLEAKKSCPNADNHLNSKEKAEKFEEYYTSITDKFVSSLQIYLATLLERFPNTEEVGDNLKSIEDMRDIKLKFVLVIKDAEDVAWLAGPATELKARLLQFIRIWDVEIIVLNEELAGKYRLIC